MNTRRALAVVVGTLQSMIAASTFIFACILYFDFFGTQSLLDAPVKSPNFHVSTLFIFGFFSLVSGLFLVHEWLESR